MKYDAVVAGGGVMGLSTAYALLKRGVKRVLVLERQSIGHERASSSDASRAIRYEYAESEMYSRMVGRSIELWRELERATGAGLYVNCGVVCWGRGDAPYTHRSFETLSRMGLPIREVTPQELCALYPQFDVADMTYTTVNPEGGFLRASDCLKAVASRIERLGGEIRQGTGVANVETKGETVAVEMESGETIEAAKVAITVGPWSTTLLPRLGLNLPITANKQQTLYIRGLPPGFEPSRFPVFLNLDHDFYGFPLDSNGLMKVSLHFPGPAIDPDDVQSPDPDYARHLWSLVQSYIPEAARRGEPARSRVCMYTMTPDEDFILDHLPGKTNVVIGAGFSGHGFKFGPLIGEMLAALLLSETPEFPTEPFSIARFA